MPFVPRLFLKTGIVYLALTFLLGAALLSLEAVGRPVPFIVGIEHGHMAFVGWLVNTVIGVALWLLPANRAAFPETQGRYPETPARLAFFSLNVGLIARLIGEPLQLDHATAVGTVVLITAAALQLAGIVIVAWIVWRRVFAPPLRPNI
jgi:hypothetical protein